MKFRSLASAMLACSAVGAAGAQQLSLMPIPSSLQRQNGAFVVTPAHGNSALTIQYTAMHDDRLESAAMRMVRQLDTICGGQVRESVLTGTPGPESLVISVASAGDAIQNLDEDESYALNITPAGVKLAAPTDLGAMHGMQTILQLANYAGGACVLPSVTVQDTPRFHWRGLMIDVSRHFEPVDVIKRNLDGMAAAKLNVFHWHLSDDQGWRAESLKYPKLTQLASDGQFYTQEQMRDVVAYARARGIRVVPEFDVPGHSSAAILAYPELGSAGAPLKQLPIVYGMPADELDPTNEKTYKFINTLVGEMGAIFPDEYFHIGGDEVEGKHWMANPKIRAFMAKKGFTTPAQLQAYFNTRVLAILTKHHKKMIGWDEILQPDLPKDIVIQSWRGTASLSAGAKMGFQGILSAPYYLDGQKTSGQMFLADPIPADTTLAPEQQKLILGGEVCMWAEQIDPETIDSRIWPRTLAIAERLWSPQGDRDVSFMYQRLRPASLRLEDTGLTHISGPERLRRSLATTRHPEALDLLASVTEPVTFGQRYHGQKTSGYTTLDRLVDAVVADPPSRQQFAGDVEGLLGHKAEAQQPGNAPANLPKDEHTHEGDVPEGFAPARRMAIENLRARFLAWQQATPNLVALSKTTPRLNDIAPLAFNLDQMGAVGLEALDYVQTDTAAPAEWTQHANAVIGSAQQGAALVRFTFLYSLQKLVDAAGQR